MLLLIPGGSVVPSIMVGVAVVGMMVWVTVVPKVGGLLPSTTVGGVVPAIVVGVVVMLLRWSIGRRDGSGGAWVLWGIVWVIPFS